MISLVFYSVTAASAGKYKIVVLANE